MIRIAIIDPHHVARIGLRFFLQELEDIRIAAEGSSAHDATEVARSGAADVLVAGLSAHSGQLDDALETVRSISPAMPILVLAPMPGDLLPGEPRFRDADCFLDKACDDETFVRAVRAIAKGRAYSGASCRCQELRQESGGPLHALLSPREYQVFLRLAKGETVGRIAEHLDISVKTVSTFRTRVLQKLNKSSNSGLVHYALKSGLLD